MSEPKRWIDDASELSRDELYALEAALGAPEAAEFALAEQAKHAVWGVLATQLPGTAVLAAGKASPLATLAKPLALGLALGAGTAGGLAITAHLTAPRPAEVHVAATSAPARATGASEPGPPARSLERGPVAADSPPAPKFGGTGPAPVGTSGPSSPPTSGGVEGPAPEQGPSVASFPASDAAAGDRAEIDRMGTARALLRSGRSRAALSELDALAKDFPNGTLAQEREALAVQALGALGERAAARERALRFLARYPASPHAAVVRRALDFL